MKRLFILLAVSVFMLSCGGSQGLDQTKPENVVEAVFKAAKSGNFEELKLLCDPNGENDGDTRRICELTEEDKAEFVEFFKDGKVSGQAAINGDEAEVPFTFGPGGTETETMRLIKRGDKWYLYSF